MSTTALRTATQTQPPQKSFKTLLEEMRPQFAAALPKHISADRMIRVALTCYRQIPDLRKCTIESVMGAIVQCAQLGLEPGLLGQAYLIPFKKNWKEKDPETGRDVWKSRMECQFIPGYKGLISLARRTGEVTSITATTVRKTDKFEIVLGIDPTIEHKPNLDLADRGDIRLVYVVAKFKDGGYHMEWMTKAEIDAIRVRSKAKDSGPWVTDYEQMAKKTVIRRACNYLPMSVELQNAITASDAADMGKGVVIDGDFAEVDEQGPTGEAITHEETENADFIKRNEQAKADEAEKEKVATPTSQAGNSPQQQAPLKSVDTSDLSSMNME